MTCVNHSPSPALVAQSTEEIASRPPNTFTPPTRKKNPPDSKKVPRTDARGTVRRLRALAAEGWPVPDIAEALDESPRLISKIRDGGARTVTVALAEKITVLFIDLESCPGPSPHARLAAQAHRWASRQDWYGHDIDNPAVRHGSILAGVDGTLVARVAAGLAPITDLPAEHWWIPVRTLRAQWMHIAVVEILLATAPDVAEPAPAPARLSHQRGAA
jgi:hypothetical protein